MGWVLHFCCVTYRRKQISAVPIRTFKVFKLIGLEFNTLLIMQGPKWHKHSVWHQEVAIRLLHLASSKTSFNMIIIWNVSLCESYPFPARPPLLYLQSLFLRLLQCKEYEAQGTILSLLMWLGISYWSILGLIPLSVKTRLFPETW